jgi:tetratricopeptide (TPR) repeat protein
MRASARARVAGVDAAERVARRAWQIAHPAALAPMVTDLPPPSGEAGSTALVGLDQPDPRRPRARRVGGTLAIALNLEAGLDAERRGALGTALAAYGAVIGADPERLEAWTGIRRVARAAGDTVGEARALARLGALIRDPEAAAGVLVDAATAYEQAGRVDDAITALAKAVELRPAEPIAYERAHALLRADLDSPGRGLLLDALLSHRLVAAPLSAGARVAVLFERAQHRAQRLGARAEAIEDWKEILGLQPEHREALYQLAAASLAEEDRTGAAQWLERFLSVARDDGRVADARLDLAACYESTGDPARAIETLKGAAAARPGDARPLDRLADLHLRLGDWRHAVEVLRAAEVRLPSPLARAALHLRIGAVLRDMGRDGPGAAAAFRTAAELDPLGEGTRALVALFDATKSPRGALETIEREIADIRRALAADPLDQRRLERLGEYLAMARTRGSVGPIADAELATASVLALVRNLWQPPTEVEARVPARPLVLPAKSARAFWAALADPAASGFIAEVWPHIVEAAASLFPAAQPRDRRTAVAIGDPRFTWIRASAATLGLPDLALFVARDATVPWVVAIEEPGPGMVLAPGAEGAPEARFFIGRALGLLLQRATLLERVSPDDLAPVFASAAVVAGSTSTPAALAAPPDDILRAVTRTIGRKDRKALALQASRFAFEALDLAVWQEAVVRTAERLGLLVADDVGLAAVSLAAEGNRASRAPLPDGAGAASAVATNPPALDVIRFALGDEYPVLRRAVSDAAASVETSAGPSDGRPGSGPGGRA